MNTNPEPDYSDEKWARKQARQQLADKNDQKAHGFFGTFFGKIVAFFLELLSIF